MPDIVAQWNILNQPTGVSPGSAPKKTGKTKTGANAHRLIDFADRTAQSFCVPKSDIAREGYDLSINRYKEVVHEEVDHRPPQAILDELESIEEEITQGMKQLRGMLK